MASKKKLIPKDEMPEVENPQSGQIQVYEEASVNAGEKGTWRWRLRAANGKIIANSGEGYMRKAAALKAANRMLDYTLPEVTVVELEEVVAAPQPPTVPPVTSKPGKPSNLVVSKGVGQNTLSWSAPSTGGAVAMYHVYRKIGKGKWREIVTHADHLTATTYVDHTSAKKVMYKVVAMGMDGKHGASSNVARPSTAIPPVVVTPPATPIGQPSTPNQPFVRILSPISNTRVEGTFAVFVEAHDLTSGNVVDAAGISQVDLYVDGRIVGSEQRSVDAKYKYEVNSVLYLSGEHLLMARAIDKDGNKADSSVVHVNVRN
jgi:uncharacterized protein YegP (UPF0339 family)